jgi:REP element-mobilizing transposase RayT
MDESRKFWHLCTPGQLSGEIFRERKDFVYGMNLVALLAAIHMEWVAIYTFELMHNHFHFVVSGEECSIMDFFNDLYKRLKRYLVSEERFSDLKGFYPTLVPIENITHLRNVIVYANRNGYLVNKNTTPFSYYWGANRYFFSLAHEYEDRQKVLLHDIPINERRKIFRSHFNDFPQNYYFTEDYISPYCYVLISEAESLFKSAHDYFSLVSRSVETFASISKELGDKIAYTDEELSSVIYTIAMDKYRTKPFELEKNAKLDVAKTLHFKYNAPNQQIRRVLRLDIEILEELFPSSRQ